MCRLWSGRSHHRYLKFEGLHSNEGIGACLLRIAWALDRVISFDLEPIFVGPFLAGHGTGDFGQFMGLTGSPSLAIQDPSGFATARHQNVPLPEGEEITWFREQENRTSVVYEVEAMKMPKLTRSWGKPIRTPNSDPRVCRYVGRALRNMYWSAPREHGRCRTFLADARNVPPKGGDGEGGETAYHLGESRPWVLAVHVRRGDALTFHHGERMLPPIFYSAVVRSVLRGIAAIDSAARRVSILVFSEGPSNMTGLKLPDEKGTAVTWDIQRESCLDLGLNCSQVR